MQIAGECGIGAELEEFVGVALDFRAVEAGETSQVCMEETTFQKRGVG